jgi:hypothetical protein
MNLCFRTYFNTLYHASFIIFYYNQQMHNYLTNYHILTLNLLTTTIVAPPSNAGKWQMGFNSVFKGLIINCVTNYCI